MLIFQTGPVFKLIPIIIGRHVLARRAYPLAHLPSQRISEHVRPKETRSRRLQRRRRPASLRVAYDPRHFSQLRGSARRTGRDHLL